MLPDKSTWQIRMANVPGTRPWQRAWQTYSAKAPGRSAWQTYMAKMCGKLVRQTCPASTPGRGAWKQSWQMSLPEVHGKNPGKCAWQMSLAEVHGKTTVRPADQKEKRSATVHHTVPYTILSRTPHDPVHLTTLHYPFGSRASTTIINEEFALRALCAEAGKNWGMLFGADFLRGNVENLKILKLLEPM